MGWKVVRKQAAYVAGVERWVEVKSYGTYRDQAAAHAKAEEVAWIHMAGRVEVVPCR
jgi:hypothetical protein